MFVDVDVILVCGIVPVWPFGRIFIAVTVVGVVTVWVPSLR